MRDVPYRVTSSAGFVPESTTDPAWARELVRRDGAAILTGRMQTPESAADAAGAVFTSEVRAVGEPAEVRAGGVNDIVISGAPPTPEQLMEVHTDGFAYGDAYPDQFVFLCAISSFIGGDSFLVDGYALMDGLGETDEGIELVRDMETIPIDQTEPGMQVAVSPLVGRTSSGRRMLRRCPVQRPRPDSDDPDRDLEMIAVWDDLCRHAGALAPRFKLQPGEALVVDNYRIVHGRDPYEDIDRLMWRVWVWTAAAYAVPEGLLTSDTRKPSGPRAARASAPGR
jgi:gamma-butyrobetaine dioxygenase